MSHDDVMGERLRIELERAIEPEGFLDWRETIEYAEGIDPVLADVAALVDQGRPELALELAEYAIALMYAQEERVDDSNGQLGWRVMDARDIHLKAAAAARPDPVEFGRRLAAMAIEHPVLRRVGYLQRYGSVLGETGVAAFIAAVEDECQKLPAPPPAHPYAISDLRHRIEYLRNGEIGAYRRRRKPRSP